MPSSGLSISEEDRATLESLTRSRTASAGQVERAQIVLAVAGGAGTTGTADLVGVSRPTVIKWRDRFAAHGLAGLDDECLGTAGNQGRGGVPSGTHNHLGEIRIGATGTTTILTTTM